ncbi:ISY1 (YJR050W) [Zygosaccharomyces parabailii]|uniref:Pre-mRNA-splicing factor ISY1 n=1 Tax=Zygosaccharomyces bailii (strain CLIB 213 / ATCC 58445 / CBS 680 / BCRC 21525 / NBRC 1098 / NCYC 1416 / NRRL Y-2227) TaxID=1333698 RepID=A0A8J2T9J4_ZYGB2|nr:ISY1 (YJR050W) [Zygosaccharomyces parabailii]CDF90969.1 ZYBA0S09-01860g1_1 [Zygosaccharomyces bailii CLIB 213]CDH08697.1 related to Pre-mRNA-splicing factor ISY1 [Zygosaccharomyces bailii ISA1307]SJM86080.1 related to Pre-mRNA-splicing factor ISY1 [Zygosaccharomyces bailii]
MSRNVDKANSVLVRYQELQAEEKGGYKDFSRYKRPKKVGSVRSIKEALEWRKQVVKELADKITNIYDPSLNDVQIEELNDRLNELYKEKDRWDWHITRVLHGTRPRRDNIVSGKIIKGKRYFGRAVELPQVKLLLKQELESRKKHKSLVDIKLIEKERNTNYDETSRPSQELMEFETTWTPLLRKHYNKVSGRISLDSDSPPDIKDMERWLVERRKQKLLKELQL